MIEAGRVAKPDGVGRREQSEIRVRLDDLVLVEQGQAALRFQDALDDEHDVRAAGIVFVEDQGDRTLNGPRQDAFAELGDLLAVLEHDGVLADQVDPRDVAVEIDADQRPVQAGGDLFDMGRLAGAVKALDHHPAIEGETGADGKGRLRVEAVGVVDVRHVAVALREGRHLHVRIDAEHLADGDLGVGNVGQKRIGKFKRVGRHWQKAFSDGQMDDFS